MDDQMNQILECLAKRKLVMTKHFKTRNNFFCDMKFSNSSECETFISQTNKRDLKCAERR